MELAGKLAFTPAEVATLLGVSRAKVYNMMREGRLPYVDLGNLRRIPRSDLEALLRPASKGRRKKGATK